MNVHKILVLVFLLFIITKTYSTECKKIATDKNQMIMTSVEVEGPRGTLTLPALIDTGANMSVIPKSIAEGIGYTQTKNGKFSTVSGKITLKIITLKKLSFSNIDFHNIEVAIEKKKVSNYLINPINWNFNKNKITKKVKDVETAIIGMSELSKTDFTYKDKIFTICQ